MAKHKKRTLRVGRILVLLLVVLLAVCGILFHNYKKALKPAQELGENVLFTVNAGDSARTVASNLEKAGLSMMRDTAICMSG